MLAKRLVNAIARGVLCFASLIGITGDTAILVSTMKNINPQTPLADMRPHMSGCDQGRPSIDLRDKPRSKDPTVRTSVNDPRKSIRLSLVRRVKERTSSGSGMSTFIETSTIDNTRIGTCNQLCQCFGPGRLMLRTTYLKQECCSPEKRALGYNP